MKSRVMQLSRPPLGITRIERLIQGRIGRVAAMLTLRGALLLALAPQDGGFEAFIHPLTQESHLGTSCAKLYKGAVPTDLDAFW